MIDLTTDLKDRLLNDIEEVMPYGIDSSTSAFKVEGDTITVRTMVYDTEAEFNGDDEYWGFSINNSLNKLEYSSDNRNHNIDTDELLSVISLFASDIRFKEQVMDTFIRSDTESEVYQMLLKQFPQVKSDNLKECVEYTESDFFTLIANPGQQHLTATRKDKKNVFSQGFNYLLQELDEYGLDSEQPKIDEDFFDEAFSLIQKYRLVDYPASIPVDIGNDGTVQLLDTDRLQKGDYVETIELQDSKHQQLANAFAIADLEERSGVIRIKLVHSENESLFPNQSLIAFSWSDAFEFLGDLHDNSKHLITDFDEARGQGYAALQQAKWRIEPYNDYVHGDIFCTIDYEFKMNEDDEWILIDKEYVATGYTGDARKYLSEICF